MPLDHPRDLPGKRCAQGLAGAARAGRRLLASTGRLPARRARHRGQGAVRLPQGPSGLRAAVRGAGEEGPAPGTVQGGARMLKVPCCWCHSSLRRPPGADSPGSWLRYALGTGPLSRSGPDGTQRCGREARPTSPMLRCPTRRRCATRSCTPSWPTTSASRAGARRLSRTPSRSSRSSSTSWPRQGSSSHIKWRLPSVASVATPPC